MKLGRAGAVVLVAVLVLAWGCEEDATTPSNSSPEISALTPVSAYVQPGASVLFRTTASDPDGDPLTFEWTFSAGTPLTAQGDRVLWTAGNDSALVTVQVTADDGRGGQSGYGGSVTVAPSWSFPYTVPAEGTMDLDFSQLSGSRRGDGERGVCHLGSALLVTWANVVVLAYTGLPTLAFAAALNQAVAWTPPNTWLWAYTVGSGADSVTVELVAEVSQGIDIDWTMMVTGGPQNLDRFEIVTGTSQLPTTEGFWILYDPNAAVPGVSALEVNWSRAALDDRHLDYINVYEGTVNFADTLAYAVAGSTATVRYVDVSETTMTRVEWDVVTGTGKLHNAAGDSCCWGPAPTFADVVCP
jgi:hypothetical protein